MRALTLLFWIVVAIAFAVFIWPTRWRYDHMTSDGNLVPVRIDRFSGEADMLVPEEGWVPVESSEDSTGGQSPVRTAL